MWKEVWSFAKHAWAFGSRYVNMPLAATIGAIVLLVLLSVATAQANAGPGDGLPIFPIIVSPDSDPYFIATSTPLVLVLCQKEPGADGIHLCQSWQVISQTEAVAVGGAAYCFIQQEEEVIHRGEPATRRDWSCGPNRQELAEEWRKVDGDANLWGQSARKGEIST